MSEATAATATPPADAPTQSAIERASSAPRTVVRYGERGAVVSTVDDLWQLAKIMAYGMDKVPAGGDTKAEHRAIYGVAVMIQAGAEVGISPVMSTRALYPVDGRPAWMVEGAVALLRSKGVIPSDKRAWCHWFENEPPIGTALKDWPDKTTCHVQLRLKAWGHEPAGACAHLPGQCPSAVVYSFTVADAKTLGKWNRQTRNGGDTPWTTRPKRMLYARPAGDILRDHCSEHLMGLSFVHEVDDFTSEPRPPRGAPPEPASGPGLLSAITAAEPGETIDVSAEPVDVAEPEPAPDAQDSAQLEPEPTDEAPAFDASAAEDRLANAVGASVDEHERANVLRAIRPEPLTSQADLAAALVRLAEHPASAVKPGGQAPLFDAPAAAHRDTGARRKR